MIDLKGYEDVQAVTPGEFPKLPAGGYVCQILHAELTKSKADNPMLVLFIDIAEGDFAGYFKDSSSRVKSFRSDSKWDNSAIYRQLIFDKGGNTSRFFKGLITCIEKSNPNFKINPRAFDEQRLRGLLIGCLFAEEEYERRDATIGTRLFIKFPKTVDDIHSGNFTVPELKKLPATAPATPKQDDWSGTPVDNDDIPF